MLKEIIDSQAWDPFILSPKHGLFIPEPWLLISSPPFPNMICYRHKTQDLKIICTLDTVQNGDKYYHVSLSRKKKLPSWHDIKIVKNAFFGDEKEAFHVIPRESEYVNLHKYCFHLWCKVEELAND